MNFSSLVYFGNCGALAGMRRLGSQTLSPFIDKSYDDIADNSERLRAGLTELDRLIAMSKTQLAELHAALRDRLSHNFSHVHRPDSSGFRAVTHRLEQALAMIALADAPRSASRGSRNAHGR